ncbi:hypothetical protein VP01_3430g2 [Puccinia sorghi]|uniref:PIPK domain-containing protein n=1 Tax=Puccinia sorghi TaxID=27349 RepID=A0A0L6UXB1_9BASI|nr:hypothetical protein VP01_3430g2 [Puccinia sorghi]
MTSLAVNKPHFQIYYLKRLTCNWAGNVTRWPHKVLLDGNFYKSESRFNIVVWTSPIFFPKNYLLRLQASLHNNTLFLANHNVMDYSLAFGFDQKKQYIYIGIIGMV